MNKKTTILIVVIFPLALLTAFGAGFWLHSELYPTLAHFPVLSEAYELIQKHGYEDIPESPKMEYGAIQGMVNVYEDQHTYFLEPVQTELSNDTLSGSYGGIGAQMSRDPQGFIVIHPFPDGPAVEGGLQDGDRLVIVDGKEITPEILMEEVVALVRGPEGQKIQLIIARPPNFNEIEFYIKRANIPLPSVTYHLDASEPQLGVVRVNVIASSTPNEIQVAVSELQSRGANYFALDLRGNGGGLLKEGVDIARLFLDEGVIIQYQYKGEDVETYEAKKPGALADIPLVILVDGNTASAAEIISGAMQNQGRAPLIGTQTFGKDSIQLVFELQDKSSLHVTSAKWWVPGLKPALGEGGLFPDVEVNIENAGDTDSVLDAAIQYLFGD